MGGILNQLTQPLGIRMFPGGPYPDAGFGDVQAKQAGQYNAEIGKVIQALASGAGVTNPVTGEAGAFSNDPYGLNPTQSAAVNKQAGIDRQAYDKILSTVKANLNARGMGDSETMTAAQTYLDQQLAVQMGGERLQAGENAYQDRNTVLAQIGQLLGQGYGAQASATASQKQGAEAASQNSMMQLGNLLALGMYAGGVGPFGKSSAPAGTPPIAGNMLPSGAGPKGGYGSGFGSGFQVPANFGSVYP